VSDVGPKGIASRSCETEAGSESTLSLQERVERVSGTVRDIERVDRSSSPRALPVRISNTPAATGKYRMVKVGEKVGPAKILSRTFSYGT
jgi:hypothetical protein